MKKLLPQQQGILQRPYKIIHDKFRKKGNENLEEELARDFDYVVNLNKDFEQGLRKAYEELDPLKTYKLFENIAQDEILLFDMDFKMCHPVDLLVTQLPAPPIPIRPSVAVTQNVTNEDDLTMKLAEILQVNTIIKTSID